MQIEDIDDKAQAEASANWSNVYLIRKAWMDYDRPVDLVGRIANEDGPDTLLVAEVEEEEEDDDAPVMVWLMPEDGVTFPFTPEEYEPRPITKVKGDILTEGPTRYDRAWDIVQEYRGEI